MGDNLGSLIRTLRETLGLSLRDLEELSGINRGTLSKVENGQIDFEPGDERLDFLAKSLGAKGAPSDVSQTLTAAAARDMAESFRDMAEEFRTRLAEAHVPPELRESVLKAVSPETMRRVVAGEEKVEIRHPDSVSPEELKARKARGEEVHVLGVETEADSAMDYLDRNADAFKAQGRGRRPGPAPRVPVHRFYAGPKGAIHVFEDLDPNREKQVRQLAKLLRTILEE